MDFIKQVDSSPGSTRRKFLFGMVLEDVMIFYFMESKSLIR